MQQKKPDQGKKSVVKHYPSTKGGKIMNFLNELYCKFIGFIGNRNEKGQTLVEYALLLVLIAIVVIAIITAVGRSTCNVYSAVNSALQPAAS
jgi:pilus assembly protein Flp/PilA